MQALKLARKYPSFSQGEMMQLVDQFKSVVSLPPSPTSTRPRSMPHRADHEATHKPPTTLLELLALSLRVYDAVLTEKRGGTIHLRHAVRLGQSRQTQSRGHS